MRTSLTRATLSGALIGVLALTGCAALPPSPGTVPQDWVPSPSAEPDQNNVALSPDGFSAAQRMTVRVRNIGCGFVATGTGFALDAFTLVTNRHVVANSNGLEVSTHDGRVIEVKAAEVTTVADIAIVHTESALGGAFATRAKDDPDDGDAITVVGYPNGGRLTTTTGVVLGETEDPVENESGGAVATVLATTAVVQPGSSGSPALNEAGEVVGVVYARSNSSNQSYIVPVSTLNSLLAQPKLLVPEGTNCGSGSDAGTGAAASTH